MVLANLMRWVRIRGLKEGPMQFGHVDGLPNDARDDAQRPQDYGFAGNPVDGQGLKLEIGGHTVIVRMDRLADRPQLAAYEVAVWHKDGHRITLMSGGVIEVNCTLLKINAPHVTMSGDLDVAGTVTAGVAVEAPTVSAATSLKVDGKEVLGHNHGSVQHGDFFTDGF